MEIIVRVAWISLPDIPPNFFVKKEIFSIAFAVGKPLSMDITTRNQTRPSCAKGKIKVDLVAKLPQRVRINEKDDVMGEIKSNKLKSNY